MAQYYRPDATFNAVPQMDTRGIAQATKGVQTSLAGMQDRMLKEQALKQAQNNADMEYYRKYKAPMGQSKIVAGLMEDANSLADTPVYDKSNPNNASVQLINAAYNKQNKNGVYGAPIADKDQKIVNSKGGGSYDDSTPTRRNFDPLTQRMFEQAGMFNENGNLIKDKTFMYDNEGNLDTSMQDQVMGVGKSNGYIADAMYTKLLKSGKFTPAQAKAQSTLIADSAAPTLSAASAKSAKDLLLEKYKASTSLLKGNGGNNVTINGIGGTGTNGGTLKTKTTFKPYDANQVEKTAEHINSSETKGWIDGIANTFSGERQFTKKGVRNFMAASNIVGIPQSIAESYLTAKSKTDGKFFDNTALDENLITSEGVPTEKAINDMKKFAEASVGNPTTVTDSTRKIANNGGISTFEDRMKLLGAANADLDVGYAAIERQQSGLPTANAYAKDLATYIGTKPKTAKNSRKSTSKGSIFKGTDPLSVAMRSKTSGDLVRTMFNGNGEPTNKFTEAYDKLNSKQQIAVDKTLEKESNQKLMKEFSSSYSDGFKALHDTSTTDTSSKKDVKKVSDNPIVTLGNDYKDLKNFTTTLLKENRADRVKNPDYRTAVQRLKDYINKGTPSVAATAAKLYNALTKGK